MSIPLHTLELISITISYQNLTFHTACFYRPPSSSTDLLSLSNLLLSAGPSLTSRLILVGDFNVNTLAPTTPLSSQLSSISTLFSLKQFITLPTHFSHSGSPSIVDLVFAPPSLKPHVSILHPVGSSDHKSIIATISLPPSLSHKTPIKSPSEKIWLYHQANFESINEHLLLTDWKSILPPNLDDAWSTFSTHFLSTVHRFTPAKTISTTPLPPWFPRLLLHKISWYRSVKTSIVRLPPHNLNLIGRNIVP